MPLGQAVSKTGYVLSYVLYLNPKPTLANKHVYFTVTISDSPKSAKNEVEFKLIRNRSSSIDDTTGGYQWCVTYGSVEMAMIATIKEALVHGKRITIKGRSVPMGHPGAGKWYNSIESVTIKSN